MFLSFSAYRPGAFRSAQRRRYIIMLCCARLLGNYISQLGIPSYSHSQLNRNIFISSQSNLTLRPAWQSSQSGLEDRERERERDQRLAAGSVLNTTEERRGDVREMDWLVGLVYF